MTGRSRRELLAALAGSVALAGCGSTASTEPSPTVTPVSVPNESSTESADGPTLSARLPGAEMPAAPATERSVAIGCDNEEKVYFFSPSLAWIDPGVTLQWGLASRCRQQSIAYHPDNGRPLRIPTDATPWESPVMQGTDTFTHTFETPGVYDVTGLFEHAGQVSTVVVGRPTLSEEPAMLDDGSALPAPARANLDQLHEAVRAVL